MRQREKPKVISVLALTQNLNEQNPRKGLSGGWREIEQSLGRVMVEKPTRHPSGNVISWLWGLRPGIPSEDVRT